MATRSKRLKSPASRPGVSGLLGDGGSPDLSFDRVRAAYAGQIAALAEGGVDILLIETIFDTLGAKAAITAARGGPGLAALDLGHHRRPERAHPHDTSGLLPGSPKRAWSTS
ncbi:MAG TPA: homocysteine S-methyltransferase family protein [Streptosporangiaceae bacterium]|nr:homocysteine S-methyltransferase family protein [Streptosporangiaceae bacterium]